MGQLLFGRRQLKESIETRSIINLKYTLVGLLIAVFVGYAFSTFTGIKFWASFSIVVVVMLLNGLLAEYEDNLHGGFNNPMSEEEIEIENIKRNKRLLPMRIIIWVSFISFLGWLAWAYVNKSV